ncbi:MAG: choice-of-anchor Q domain-containing protein, partial [Planctomycetota bacterium]
ISSTASVTYSNVQGGWVGQGNIDEDPCFVDAGYWSDANGPNVPVVPNGPNVAWVDGDYHLLAASACINAGDPNYVAGPNERDVDGQPRVWDGRIDMGADEFVPPIECQVGFMPRVINRHSRMKRLMAFVLLPEGISGNQVDRHQRFVLYPGGIEAVYQRVLPRSSTDTGRTIVGCFFDKTELLAAITEDGRVQLELAGQLINGQQCCGTGSVFIRNSDQVERIWLPNSIRRR